MSSEEFWKEDPQLFVSYRTSFINKKKREIEEDDYKSWRQGLYIYNGNGVLMHILTKLLTNMLSGTKDNSDIGSYPEKPYTELSREKQETKEQNNNNNIKEDRYNNYINSLNYYGSIKQRYLDKLTRK